MVDVIDTKTNFQFKCERVVVFSDHVFNLLRELVLVMKNKSPNENPFAGFKAHCKATGGATTHHHSDMRAKTSSIKEVL